MNVLYKRQKYVEAVPVAEAAVKLRQEALGPRHADTATSLDDLGAILMQNGDVAAAEAKMREALAIRREVLGPDDPQLSTSLNNVGFVLQEKGDVDQAQAMFLESLAIDRRRLGNDHPEVAIKLVNLARLNNNRNNNEAAEPFAREAVAIRRKVLGNEHPGLVNALDQLSSAVELREPAEAERLSREALAISTRAYGANHRETARLQNNLGFILYKQGEYREAVTLYRAATDTFRQTVGADAPLTLGAQVGLAQNLNAIGDFRAAEATMREVLAVYRKQPTNKQVTTTLMALGDALAGQRRYKEAIPYFREVNGIYDQTAPTRVPWYKPEAQSMLGAALGASGEGAEGERLMLAGYEVLRALPSTPPVTAACFD